MAADVKPSGIEWIGDIPSDWHVDRFKHLLASNDGGVWGNDARGDAGDCVVLRSTEQTVDGYWAIDDPAIRSLAEAPNVADFILQPGDLLITKSSGSLNHIGKTTLFESETYSEPCCYSNFMQRLRLKSPFVPKFYWYLLNCDVSRAQFAYLQNTTTGLGNLSAGSIGSVWFPVPPVEEQERIAKSLDEFCKSVALSIGSLEQQIDLLERYRTSVIHEMVTKGPNSNVPMKPSGVEWMGDIPSEWSITKLKYIARTCNGLDYDSEDVCSPDDSGATLVVRSSNISNGEMIHADDVFVNTKIPDSVQLRKDDLVIVRANGSPSLVGKSALFSLDGSCVAGGFMLICRSEDNRFLRWVLQSNLLPYYRGAFDTTTINRLSATMLGNMLIPWPSKGERKQIAKILSRATESIDAVIDTKRRQLDVLKKRRQSLIYEYVTGKRRVGSKG